MPLSHSRNYEFKFLGNLLYTNIDNNGYQTDMIALLLDFSFIYFEPNAESTGYE